MYDDQWVFGGWEPGYSLPLVWIHLGSTPCVRGVTARSARPSSGSAFIIRGKGEIVFVTSVCPDRSSLGFCRAHMVATFNLRCDFFGCAQRPVTRCIAVSTIVRSRSKIQIEKWPGARIPTPAGLNMWDPLGDHMYWGDSPPSLTSVSATLLPQTVRENAWKMGSSKAEASLVRRRDGSSG